jgi:cobalamin biosynthesis protein CbiG
VEVLLLDADTAAPVKELVLLELDSFLELNSIEVIAELRKLPLIPKAISYASVVENTPDDEGLATPASFLDTLPNELTAEEPAFTELVSFLLTLVKTPAPEELDLTALDSFAEVLAWLVTPEDTGLEILVSFLETLD